MRRRRRHRRRLAEEKGEAEEVAVYFLPALFVSACNIFIGPDTLVLLQSRMEEKKGRVFADGLSVQVVSCFIRRIVRCQSRFSKMSIEPFFRDHPSMFFSGIISFHQVSFSLSNRRYFMIRSISGLIINPPTPHRRHPILSF